MDKLIELKNKTLSINIQINPHKEHYFTATNYLNNNCDLNEMDRSVLEGMIDLDTIIEIQFYPYTPINCYEVFHYSLNEALLQCLEIIYDIQNDGCIYKG